MSMRMIHLFVSNCQEYIQSSGTRINRVLVEGVYYVRVRWYRETWTFGLTSKDVGTGRSSISGCARLLIIIMGSDICSYRA